MYQLHETAGNQLISLLSDYRQRRLDELSFGDFPNGPVAQELYAQKRFAARRRAVTIMMVRSRDRPLQHVMSLPR